MFSRNCPKCNKKLTYTTKSSLDERIREKSLCKSCAGKAATRKDMSGTNNPFFGKKHTEITKKQMSKNHADFTGDKNPFKKSLSDINKRLQHKDRCQQIWNNRDKEYRKKFGSNASIAQQKYKSWNSNIHKKHISGHFTTTDGRTFFYRSSWEKIFLENLDLLKNQKEILDFKLEPFCITYYYQGFPYITRVDFLITLNNKQQVLIECKPVGLRKIGKNPLKICAYIEYCILHNLLFCLVEKKDIISTESIKNTFEQIIKKSI